MSFNKGDRIRVKENGFLATVKGVSFNSIHQEWEYYVIWDNMPDKGECCYTANDVGDLWEKVAQIKDANAGYDPGSGYTNQDPDAVSITLPVPKNGYYYEINGRSPEKKACEHRWVEVGFMHTKTVCYHCDVEKK